MNYTELRNEAKKYHQETSFEKGKINFERIMSAIESEYKEGMTAYEMKALQYGVIAEECEPILFEHCPFYYETGMIPGYSDGCAGYKGWKHAGGFTAFKNEHLFIDQDPELYELRRRQGAELLYLICGKYNDTAQHFALYFGRIFKGGLRSVYDRVNQLLETASDEEKPFLQSAAVGLLAAKRISERFAEVAQKLSAEHPENENYRRIAESAKRCPWEKPQSFYEALNCYAFMRKVVGSLDGIGPNSFGRPDIDLLPFYEADIESGKLTKDEAYALISQFLIIWDCHYDHDMKMVGYSDHELENTYTIGGCDADGKPIFNDITEMFLRAAREEGIIFPKIKCRYSKNSPKEYLALVNEPISKGTTTVIIQNDDSTVPALMRAGRTAEEARDYLVTGCWGLYTNGNDCHDDGTYMNLLKVLEFTLYQPKETMDAVNMHFRPFDGAESFDEVYRIMLENIDLFFKERTRVITKGAQIWDKVSPMPFYSSTLKDCLDSKRDYSKQGTRFKDDNFDCVGFPNVVDSLMAIKTLCFDEKRYTLDEFLAAVRRNWEGAEDIRLAAVKCPGWGDGSDESCAFARRFHTDLYGLTEKLTGAYGGKVNLGHFTYTEIRFWGERTLATPDGRHSGEYFAQGLTPSRLKKIADVTSVARSLAAIDRTELAGNSVVNLIMPDGLSLDHMDAMLRAFSDTALGSLQLNCVSRDTLLDAQKHPEKYPELIVRVCGFSAKFTSLSPEWQEEVLSRNYYG